LVENKCYCLLTIMADKGSGDEFGAPANVDEAIPDKTFKDDKEALAYWKTLALNYKANNRRLSDQVDKERKATFTIRQDLDKLQEQVTMLSHEGDYPSGSRTLGFPMQGDMKSGLGFSASKPDTETQPQLVSLDAIPKLSIFNGKDGANDYSYESWRFDVQQLLTSGFSSRVVRMAIVRSCRGTPATVLQALGDNFHPEEVLLAFDKRFASVATPETLLSQFYSASQRDGETVNAWGCRLENLLSKPQLRYLDRTSRASMLRERFWRGLRTHSLRNALRHRFDANASYEELLVCAREVEEESGDSSSQSSKSSKSSKKASVASAQISDSSLAALTKQLKDIQDRLAALEKLSQGRRGKGRGRGSGCQQQSQEKKPQSQGDKKPTCYECGKEGHYRNKCPDLKTDLKEK
jgi:hypothetical protein